MAHEVFICYATRDKAVANAVCASLEARNVKCWIAPRDVLIGTEWAESIVDALDESRVLVLVLSSSSNNSPQVIREVGRAASKGIPIIPIRIDDVVPSKAMDYFVSSHQWLEAQTGPLEEHLQRLTDTVQQILARRRTPQEIMEAKEAEEKARREAEEARKAKEAEEGAKRGAEEAAARARKEEEAARARQEAEKARMVREAEEKARKEAEEAKAQARREMEEARKAREAKDKAKREAEKAREKARKEAEKARERERKEAELAAKERAKREAKEAEEKAKKEAEEARKAKEAEEKVPVFVERRAKLARAWEFLLRRRWLWAGAGAVVVALILVLVFVLPPSETPPVEEEEGTSSGEEEEVTPTGGEEEEVTQTTVTEEEPQYGGTIVYRAESLDVVTDPLDLRSVQFGPWLETLFTDDMTVDRAEFGFLSNFFPVEYRAGQLAESWEQPDPTTVIVRLRQGIQWQDKVLGYGREFTSDDVVFTYDKVLGVGEFAGEEPNWLLYGVIPSIAEVVATDRYTVEFYLNTAHPLAIHEVLNPWMNIPMAPREWYELTEEEQADWHNVPGTGAFVLTDYVTGTSMTCARNEDYYGEDARYPENRLPYADEFKVLVLPDMGAALTALRTGQIDLLVEASDYPTLPQTQALMETNPEINVFHQPVAAPGVFFGWDTEAGTMPQPFQDIRVRLAMQLAIDNASITETCYMGTVDPDPCGLMTPLASDWDFSFDEWPPELQAEYTYNVAEAQALLAEAAADGVFSPNALGGFDTEILAASMDYPEVLEMLQNMFAEIGINMTINSMGMTEQRLLLQEGDFELLWTSIAGSASNSPSNAIQSFYEGNFDAIGQGARANDPYYNALVEDFMAATTMAEAQDIFKEADMYWLGKHWAVITFPSWSNQLVQPWIKGYMGERFWSTMTWTYISHMWIDQGVKAEYLGD